MWSHGHRQYCQYTSPKLHDVSVNGLLPYVQIPVGMHHKTVFLTTFIVIFSIYDLPKNFTYWSLFFSTNGLLLYWIMVNTDFWSRWRYVLMKRKIYFLPLFFPNKCVDAINLGNILHHKFVKARAPPYFKDQSVPIISYSYTSLIVTKTFHNKRALQDFSIDDLIA